MDSLGLDETLTDEEYEELLSRKRTDLDEAMKAGLRERDAMRAAWRPPRIDEKRRFRER